MTEYALYFETGGPVFGEGYTTLLRVRGRMLAVETSSGFEIFGVNPGGAAVFAATLNEAYTRFVEELRLALVDIAAEGNTYDEFREQASAMFATTGSRTAARWDEARNKARRGEIDTAIGLRIERHDPDLGIDVELLEEATPAANSAPQHQTPAALAA